MNKLNSTLLIALLLLPTTSCFSMEINSKPTEIVKNLSVQNLINVFGHEVVARLMRNEPEINDLPCIQEYCQQACSRQNNAVLKCNLFDMKHNNSLVIKQLFEYQNNGKKPYIEFSAEKFSPTKSTPRRVKERINKRKKTKTQFISECKQKCKEIARQNLVIFDQDITKIQEGNIITAKPIAIFDNESNSFFKIPKNLRLAIIEQFKTD